MTSKLPIDPQFGPKDAQLPFHDGRSSGAEPRSAAAGETTPGTGGEKAVLTEPPSQPDDPVEDAKFLAEEFEVPVNRAAKLVVEERPGVDPDRVADEAREELHEEQEASVDGMPSEPRDAFGQPANPYGRKPTVDDPQKKAGGQSSAGGSA